MEIYLLRHTTPDIDRSVCYGQLDVNVTESFAEEVDRLRDLLEGLSFDACVSSPLLRCRLLAEALFTDITQEPRIKELDFGEWEGIPWSKVDRETRKVWMTDFVENTVPGGESYRVMYERCEEFWLELLQQPYQRVAIVAHGGSIRSFLLRVLGMPLKNLYHFDLNFGSLSMIEVDKERHRERVMFLNR